MAETPETFHAGRYTVVRVLGEGGQATTLEAVDKREGKLVALKRFRVRGAKSWKEVELAEREARVLASISHPSLPRYVEHFEEGGELFLVTEKIEGESLAALKKKGVSFGERDVMRLLQDASRALDYLHGRAPPIVHRDLKPSNVIRRPDGSFAFIDFGAVRDRMKPEGGSTVVGTFGYMAPEQFQGRAMPASDVYAMGTTAISLLTGVEPEDLPHRGLAIDVTEALSGRRTSPALARLLTQMLEPDPDKRTTSITRGLAAMDQDNRAARGAERPSSVPPWDRHREREARREAKWDRKHREKMARFQRHMARHGGGALSPGLILLAVTIGLTVAQVAVFVALGVIVPLVLTILGLRPAAKAVRDAGEQAIAAIARARTHVTTGGTDEVAPTTPTRGEATASAGGPRVASNDGTGDTRYRVEGVEEDEDEDALGAGRHGTRDRRRGA